MIQIKIPAQSQPKLSKLDCESITTTTSYCEEKDESVINPSNAVHSAQTFLLCFFFLMLILGGMFLRSRSLNR